MEGSFTVWEHRAEHRAEPHSDFKSLKSVGNLLLFAHIWAIFISLGTFYKLATDFVQWLEKR